VALGTTLRSEASLGTMLTALDLHRSDSYDSATDDDFRCCARCGESREYCHGHTPIIPNPTLDLPPRIPVRAPVPANGVARFNLSRAQATTLAACLVDRLDQTTKMLLRFRQPTTTGRSLPVSSPRDLAFPRPKLPKGWVYGPEEVSTEVKAEVVDPSRYLSLDAPLTCGKRRLADQLDDPL
jgi:hypothetical protein